ncbi:MAG: helix-turn-helix domain-containing protein [Dehalococcoidales bacterium]|jgi:transcriptional regulator with XRE-family HTH domain|nr:helix-turn-helix transcriptional regulator [Dehalococcoidia bacterium]NCG34969.1 helix-turn-helix domain-containing protein [Dehalococcoidales bacterium]
MKISINDIVIQPTHPIHKLEPIKNLANKRNASQQKPILLKDKNQFMLYSGEKILRVAKNKNKGKIDCILKESILDIDALNLSEIYFSGLKTPTKIAKDFIEFREKNNISQQELSRRTGITPGTIHHYESLIKKLNPILLKFLDQGQLTFKEARSIADLDDFELQTNIAKPFIEGRISSVYVEKIIGNIKRNPKLSIDQIIKNVINGIEIKENKPKISEKIYPEKKEETIEEKILNFAIELGSMNEDDIPEYRRLRVISSLKILDSKIKSSLNQMNTSFLEKSKIYSK